MAYRSDNFGPPRRASRAVQVIRLDVDAYGWAHLSGAPSVPGGCVVRVLVPAGAVDYSLALIDILVGTLAGCVFQVEGGDGRVAAELAAALDSALARRALTAT